MSIISVKQRVARKELECDACLFLLDADYRNLGASFSEYRKIAKARALNWKIMPGELYEEVFFEDAGAVGTFRRKPDIHEICQKHDLYFE